MCTARAHSLLIFSHSMYQYLPKCIFLTSCMYCSIKYTLYCILPVCIRILIEYPYTFFYTCKPYHTYMNILLLPSVLYTTVILYVFESLWLKWLVIIYITIIISHISTYYKISFCFIVFYFINRFDVELKRLNLFNQFYTLLLLKKNDFFFLAFPFKHKPANQIKTAKQQSNKQNKNTQARNVSLIHASRFYCKSC